MGLHILSCDRAKLYLRNLIYENKFGLFLNSFILHATGAQDQTSTVYLRKKIGLFLNWFIFPAPIGAQGRASTVII